MQKLSNQPLSSVHFRAIGGRRLVDLHQQLTQIMIRRMGESQPDIGALFARPVINRRGNELEWVADVDSGVVRPFDQLDEPEREVLLDRLAVLLAAVREIGDAYASDSDKSRQADAALFNALAQEPSPENIYVVDDHPVLINWGCDVSEHSSTPVELATRLAGAPPAPVPDEEPERIVIRNSRPWYILKGLLLLLLLLFLLSLLLRGCSPLDVEPIVPDAFGLLPDPLAPADATDIEREQALRAEIDALSRRLREEVRVCRLPEPEPEPEPIPELEPEPSEAEERMNEHGRTLGDVDVSLLWDNYHDLDLMVEEPNGETIFFRRKVARSGGHLEIDMNLNAQDAIAEPVENIQWATGQAPSGRYRVYVMLYRTDRRSMRELPAQFRVVVSVRGEEQLFEASVNRLRQKVLVGEFIVE